MISLIRDLLNPAIFFLITCLIYAFMRQTTSASNTNHNQVLSLNDLVTIVLLTLVFCIPAATSTPIAKAILAIIFFLLSLYLTVAIIVFQQIGIHLNLKTIALAIKNKKELMSDGNEKQHIGKQLKQSIALEHILFFSLPTATYFLIILGAKQFYFLYIMSCALLIMMALKIRFHKWINILVLLLTSLIIYFAVYFAQATATIYQTAFIVLSVLMPLVVLGILLRRFIAHPFFHRSSALSKLIMTRPIKKKQILYSKTKRTRYY